MVRGFSEPDSWVDGGVLGGRGAGWGERERLLHWVAAVWLHGMATFLGAHGSWQSRGTRCNYETWGGMVDTFWVARLGADSRVQYICSGRLCRTTRAGVATRDLFFGNFFMPPWHRMGGEGSLGYGGRGCVWAGALVWGWKRVGGDGEHGGGGGRRIRQVDCPVRRGRRIYRGVAKCRGAWRVRG